MNQAQPPSVLPPGYPSEYERLVTLNDGRRVSIRPILPSDAPGLAEAIRTADPETVHRRFLGGRPQVTPKLVEHLTTVDYARRFALVAIDPGSQRGIAIARYEAASDDAAEVAVAVSPAWRHAGVATVLLLLLAEAAAERGVRTFEGSYLADNRPVTALIRDAGQYAGQVVEHGITEFSVDLTPHPAAGRGSSQPATADGEQSGTE